jgi:NADH-quinone oxidoreductase subunit E/NADP-reducing hydrogenase subunit HndA
MMPRETICCGGASTLPDEVRSFAKERVRRDRARSFLIPTLHKLQQVVGYLRDDHIAEIAALFGMSANEVKGVASFYHFFTFEPKGRHPISVCTGTACHVRGAADVLAKIKAVLGIQEGERTADGLFSLGSARCLGMCALAPVVMIGKKVYGSVTPGDVEDMLREHGFKGKAK